MSTIKGAPLSKRQQSPRFRTKTRKLETRVSRKRPAMPPLGIERYSSTEARNALREIWARPKVARSYMRKNAARIAFYRSVEMGDRNKYGTLARLAGVNVDDLEFARSTRRVLFARCRAAEVKENPPANPLDNVVDCVIADDAATTAMTPVVRVPPIHVRVVMDSTQHEGGTDGGSYGDVLLKGNVNAYNGMGSRFKIADKLRELADAVANTVGDPMVSASITVLMSRPR